MLAGHCKVPMRSTANDGTRLAREESKDVGWENWPPLGCVVDPSRRPGVGVLTERSWEHESDV